MPHLAHLRLLWIREVPLAGCKAEYLEKRCRLYYAPHDAPSVLSALKSVLPDIIVIAMPSPNADTLDIMRLIRQESPAIPMILPGTFTADDGLVKMLDTFAQALLEPTSADPDTPQNRSPTNYLYLDGNTRLPNAIALQHDLIGLTEGNLLLLDINNFNVFNKLHGFAYGDRLLLRVATSLQNILLPTEKLYKLSSDRFAILTVAFDRNSADELSNRIFAFFDTAEIEIDHISSLITFSIGIAHLDKERDVVIDAEFALDLSKRYGKRFKVFYDTDSEEFVLERENITRLLRTREYILKDMIVPYYQPIVDVTTRTLYKYEALARIITPEGDVLTPDQFLDSAERLGLLTAITKSMINKTFARFADSDTRFSINITERDIMDGYLVDFIKHKVLRHSINPANVTFEVLENLTLSKEGEKVEQIIAMVKDYGCKIAIDDFGSENSNFGRILSLQSDFLKIDGMFIRNCDRDLGKQKIVDAIVQLAKRLGIKTVAEYVSSESVFEVVKMLGVDYAQGYLFGKPEPL